MVDGRAESAMQPGRHTVLVGIGEKEENRGAKRRKGGGGVEDGDEGSGQGKAHDVRNTIGGGGKSMQRPHPTGLSNAASSAATVAAVQMGRRNGAPTGASYVKSAPASARPSPLPTTAEATAWLEATAGCDDERRPERPVRKLQPPPHCYPHQAPETVVGGGGGEDAARRNGAGRTPAHNGHRRPPPPMTGTSRYGRPGGEAGGEGG